jgi:tripartite-type tricarboxylate transporter receptor subunit TctC
MMRTLEPAMTKSLGRQLIVVNKGGGSGAVAHSYVKGAKPDGYTILGSSTSLLLTTPLMQDVNYTIDDFVSIGGIGNHNYLLCVRADSPFKTVQELAACKTRLTYANSSPGVVPHRAGAMFAKKAGLNAQTVPFNGASEGLAALLGGQVDYYVAEIPLAVPQMKAGKLRAFALTSPERYPQIPEVPTFAEIGYPDCTMYASYGLIAPKGTPNAAVAKLREALAAALEGPLWNEYALRTFVAKPKGELSQWLETVRADAAAAERDIRELGLMKKQG